MKNENPEITKMIENAPQFEQPVLKHLREVIHKACLDVEESIKWQKPHYGYKGKGMCFTDILKERVTMGFWYDSLIYDSPKLSQAAKDAKPIMGNMRRLEDIPSDEILIETIHLSMENIDQGKKIEKVVKPKKELVIPKYVNEALSKNKKAQETFENFSPSHKREYVDWIVGAKTEETRDKRIAQMIEWLQEGKSRHWQYK